MFFWIIKEGMERLFSVLLQLRRSQKLKMAKQVVILALLVLVTALAVTARVADFKQNQEGNVAIECEEGHTPCRDVCCDVGKWCCHAKWCDYPLMCSVRSPFE